ncbi:tereporin-Ca1-like [Patiria miniata]|uniref:Uncharacterized protein n=1 Tax=Patiria miniata TaxID=46514 RepID=A0A914AMT3_PATMI|nr:tereporin-Ca1-like [Patiria miniata]
MVTSTLGKYHFSEDEQRMDGGVRAGVSLLTTSAEQMLANAYTVRACAVKVVNRTQWKLKSAAIFIKGGHSVTAQHDVYPGTAEAFVAEKTEGTATSTYGTVSFQVEGLARPQYINIMWSVPFRRFINSNWLGVEVSQQYGKEDFNRMYYKPNSQMHSATREFRGQLHPLTVQTNELIITGTMGDGAKCEVCIDVSEAQAVAIDEG